MVSVDGAEGGVPGREREREGKDKGKMDGRYRGGREGRNRDRKWKEKRKERKNVAGGGDLERERTEDVWPMYHIFSNTYIHVCRNHGLLQALHSKIGL